MTTLNTADAARYLGVSAWTLRRMAGQGKVRGSYYCSAWHFEVADLDAYKDEHANRPISASERRRRQRVAS